MSKVLKALVSAPATESIDDLEAAFGPLATVTPTKAPKKEDVRDYQKTPEVNALLERFGDKSKAIRGLHKEGHKPGAIADMLRIRYQHVNNVLNQRTKS
jgi:hypothetical protein